MEIFTDWMGPGGAGQILMRWGHYLAGVTWIGLLYYFNFVQTPAFLEMTAEGRSEAMRKITWRALWWFRFGAALTLLTGLLILGFEKYLGSEFGDYFSSSAGLSIATGAILGITMFSNVWLVIWPAQQIVIGSAERVAAGGEADPNAAAAGKRGARASRANTLFSIPLLWFMGMTSHFAYRFPADLSGAKIFIYFVLFLAVAGFVELSALGKIGGYDSPACKQFFDSHKNTIIAGFALWAILYVIGFELILGS